MKKFRWPHYVIFGLVLYLLFLVIELPASWLAWGLNRHTQGAVRLDPVAGSLWRGSGRLVVYYPRAVPHDLGNADWGVNPLRLFTGRIQLALETGAPEARLKTLLSVGRETIMLKDTDATFPAASISGYYHPAALVGPQGRFRFHTSNFVLGQDSVEGDAVLEWHGAASSLSTVNPLGDYRLDIAGSGNAANLKLSTLRGDLELSGQGQWQPANGQLQLAGTAIARKREEELRPLMQLLGKDAGAGRRNFTLTHRLPP